MSETRQIRAGDDFDKIAAFQLGDVQQVVDLQNGWKWLTVKNLLVNAHYYILSLGFYTNALKQIDLIVSTDRFNVSAGWDTWSEENELAGLAGLRLWVSQELGREGTFNWGNVRTAYDRKGGSSSITITYN